MANVARKSEYTLQVRMQSAWYTAIFGKKIDSSISARKSECALQFAMKSAWHTGEFPEIGVLRASGETLNTTATTRRKIPIPVDTDTCVRSFLTKTKIS